MAQKAFAGDIAYDWELWIGREDDVTPGTYNFTQIFGFETLPFPDQVPEDVDVTHLNSPGRTRETIPGLLPVADWSQDKQLWAGDAGDVILDALAALTAAGTKEDVLFEFNIDPAGTATRRTYRGYVNSFNPTGTVGDKSMAAFSAKILDRQATNARVIV
tara:strand:+ start:16807 stop:17286 length:480 start_codon:yes stop_codon:yes gene_type:complete